jgi:hypothetical protein
MIQHAAPSCNNPDSNQSVVSKILPAKESILNRGGTAHELRELVRDLRGSEDLRFAVSRPELGIRVIDRMPMILRR